MTDTSTVTLERLNQLCEVVSSCREDERHLKSDRDAVRERREICESEIVTILMDHDMSSYKSPFGQAVVAMRTSVKTPKTDADRTAFFDELKRRGIFDTMITVNSKTLNSFYKEELEQAKAEGRDDVEIPGLNEIKMEPILSFRKV